MRFIVYARKSTSRGDEVSRSVARQFDACREFVARHGGTVVSEVKDDGTSGALFLRRPGFQEVMTAATEHRCDAVVFYSLDRFGRNPRRTMDALYRLQDLGVRVFDTVRGEVDLRTFEGRLTAGLGAEFASAYREDIRRKTRDAMHRLAAIGEWLMPAPFGYHKVGTELKVDETQATVIRERIARPFADGIGIHEVARRLNRAGIPSPRGGSWNVSILRSILKRSTYRGVYTYGASRRFYDGEAQAGDREQAQRPVDGAMTLEKPTWTIIDSSLAARVDERFAELHPPGVKGHPHKTHGRHLLSGLLICPECSRAFTGKQGRYTCGSRWRRPGSCNNTMSLPIKATDEAILGVIEAEVLGADLVDRLFSSLPSPDELQLERERLLREKANLVRAIAAGTLDDADARDEMTRIRSGLSRVETTDIEALKAGVERRQSTWREELRRSPDLARVIVRRIIGPITLHTEPPEWLTAWSAEVKLDETPTRFVLKVGGLLRAA